MKLLFRVIAIRKGIFWMRTWDIINKAKTPVKEKNPKGDAYLWIFGNNYMHVKNESVGQGISPLKKNKWVHLS